MAGWRSCSALLLATLALLVVIAGCGGDSATTTQGSSSEPTQSTSATQSPNQAQRQSQGEEAKGGEASIEEFGEEAEGAERQAILSTFTGYLEALAEEDYAATCSFFSSELRAGASRLADKALRGRGCAAILPKLLSPDAARIAQAQVEGEVSKVRVERERAFVVFHAPGAELYQQTLVEEGGEWKVASAVAGVLVPSVR